MLPMFQRELVDKNGWLTEEEMTDLFSIGQCLPGVIAANTAVFVGYKHKGALGGIFAALGVAIPSVVVVTLIAAFFVNFADIPAVQSAFVGLRVCVSVLIINAVLKLRKHSVVDLASSLIFTVIFILSMLTNVHVAILVMVAGACGVAVTSLRKRMVDGDDCDDDGDGSDNEQINEQDKPFVNDSHASENEGNTSDERRNPPGDGGSE